MIKLALVGCGYWGKNYINAIKKADGVELKWIYNRHTIISKNDLPSNCKFTKKYSDILTDKEVRGVIIATPISTHFGLAKEALNNNKDVLLEKPMTANSEEALKLLKLAKTRGKILMVGHIFMYNPAIQELKKRITEKELGNIKYLYSIRSGPGPALTDFDVFWNLAPHDISITNYLTNSLPKKVSAKGVSFLRKGILDTVDIVLTYPKDIKAFFHLSWIEPKKVREIIVVGSSKTAVFDDTQEVKLKIFKNLDIIPNEITTDKTSPLERECRHFIDCLNTNKKPISAGKEGYINVRILEAIDTSLKKNKEVSIRYK